MALTSINQINSIHGQTRRGPFSYSYTGASSINTTNGITVLTLTSGTNLQLTLTNLYKTVNYFIVGGGGGGGKGASSTTGNENGGNAGNGGVVLTGQFQNSGSSVAYTVNIGTGGANNGSNNARDGKTSSLILTANSSTIALCAGGIRGTDGTANAQSTQMQPSAPTGGTRGGTGGNGNIASATGGTNGTQFPSIGSQHSMSEKIYGSSGSGGTRNGAVAPAGVNAGLGGVDYAVGGIGTEYGCSGGGGGGRKNNSTGTGYLGGAGANGVIFLYWTE